MCVGQGSWEDELLDSTRQMDALLKEKDVPAWIDYWGFDSAHDWAWWRKQIVYFIDKLLAPDRESSFYSAFPPNSLYDMFSGFHLSFGVGLSAGWPMTMVQRGMIVSGSFNALEIEATRSSMG